MPFSLDFLPEMLLCHADRLVALQQLKALTKELKAARRKRDKDLAALQLRVDTMHEQFVRACDKLEIIEE